MVTVGSDAGDTAAGDDMVSGPGLGGGPAAVEAGCWFTDCDVIQSVLDDYGLTADTTDGELSTMSDTLVHEALTNGIHLVGVDVWLRDWRQQLRDEVGEELDEIVEQLAVLERERDELIRRAHRHGRACKDIARATKLTQPTVISIINS